MSAERHALWLQGTLRLRVDRCAAAAVSLPATDGPLAEKDLLTRAPQTAGRYSIEEHLDWLAERDALDLDAPLLVLGLRNCAVNLRCPVVLDGRVHAVEQERPTHSARPYAGLVPGGRGLRTIEALGPRPVPDEAGFFAAGVPVLWPGLRGEALMDLMLTEAADHSHLFALPRGRHPEATDASRAAWSHLHDAFAATLHTDRGAAIAGMRAALASTPAPLTREEHYLHAAIGTDAEGRISYVAAHGRLEAIGAELAALGATHGLMVENSGSVMPTWLPDGRRGPVIPLLRAPNHRPRGRAVLVLQMPSASFTHTAAR